MLQEHPLSETLRNHLLQCRGHWIAKITTELKEALNHIDSNDIRRAAVILLHGDASCSKQKIVRIADGWKFCNSIGKCECSMKNFQEKSKISNMKKFGVENAAQSSEIKQKMRDTCMERYGVEYTGALESRKLKAEQTNILRYGVSNVFESEEIKERIKKTIKERYGVEHISQDEEHKKKFKETIKKNWNVDNIAQHPDIKQKIKETNTKRYGGVSPSSSYIVRDKAKKTTIEKYGDYPQRLHIDKEHRIRSEDEFRQKYENKSISCIVAETGYGKNPIYKFAKRWDIELYSSGGTYRKAENDFYEMIKSITDDKIIRNYRIPDSTVEDNRRLKHIDFYFPEKNFGIEIGGAYWHSDACGKDMYYHENKRILAENQNIELIQIFFDEWINYPEAIMYIIRYKLGLISTQIYFDDVVIIEPVDAMIFNHKYHVNGGIESTIYYGLKCNGEVISCMSFIEHKPSEWELVNYATINSYVDDAIKLLYYFQNNHYWDTITSIIDLRWFNCDLHNVLGFKIDGYLEPEYSYVVGWNRVPKSLELVNNPKIYDAGKLKVIKINCCS